MINRINGRFISTILAVSLLGAMTVESAIASKYESKDKKYSIEFPDDWDVKEGYMGTDVMGVSKVEGETVNVVVSQLQKPQSLQEYTAGGCEALGKELTDFKLIDSGNSTIDGEPALWCLFTAKENGTAIQVLDYLFTKDKFGYVITCGSSPSNFDAAKPSLEKIAQTFKFE